MEPISALGLAANVFQFINIGLGIASESRKIYRSSNGNSTQNEELALIADDLHKLIAQCSTKIVNDQDLQRLLDSCKETAKELLSVLQPLKVRNGPNRKWASIKVAFLSVWEKEKISDMRDRLGYLRDQANFHLMTHLM